MYRILYQISDGVYTYVYEQERNPDCIVCSRRPQKLEFKATTLLKDVLEFLENSAVYQMKSPGATTTIGGKNKTLYMKTPASIEEATRKNLKLSLSDLGLSDGSQIVVADPTSPSALVFQLKIVA